jgi:nucleotide-binding universal stress UspA family protein
MFTHILIPTDGSALAEKGVASGIDFARNVGARVTLFTAVPEYQPPGEGEVMAHKRGISLEEHERRSEQMASHILLPGAARAAVAGVRLDTEYVQCNYPSEAIIAAAKRHNCDAIFMASHGRKGLARLVKGSETFRVLTESDIPTVVLR